MENTRLATPEPSAEFANVTDSEVDSYEELNELEEEEGSEEIEEGERSEEEEEIRFDSRLNTKTSVDISNIGSAAKHHSDDDDFDF